STNQAATKIWIYSSSVPNPRELPHVKSAVHVEHVAGDVTRQRRGQEQCRIDDFAHVAEAAEWNLFNKILRHFLRHAFAHADIDESRRNGVHGDVLPRKLAG